MGVGRMTGVTILSFFEEGQIGTMAKGAGRNALLLGRFGVLPAGFQPPVFDDMGIDGMARITIFAVDHRFQVHPMAGFAG